MSIKSSTGTVLKLKYVIAGILAAACWGGATVMSKEALFRVHPVAVLVIQLLASNAVLWIAVAARRPSLPPIRTLAKSGLTGILEPGLAYTFGVYGLRLTTASEATIITSTETMLIIFLAWLLLHEEISRQLIFVAVVSLTGLIMIILTPEGGVDKSSPLGDLMIFGGTVCAALYVVLTRRLVLQQLDPLLLLATQQSFALLWSLAILPLSTLGHPLNLMSISPLDFTWAVLSGVTQYALAFWFYLIALKKVPASLASLFLTLIPVFGVASAYIFLGEALSRFQWIGAALIVVSMLGVARYAAALTLGLEQRPQD